MSFIKQVGVQLEELGEVGGGDSRRNARGSNTKWGGKEGGSRSAHADIFGKKKNALVGRELKKGKCREKNQ